MESNYFQIGEKAVLMRNKTTKNEKESLDGTHSIFLRRNYIFSDLHCIQAVVYSLIEN